MLSEWSKKWNIPPEAMAELFIGCNLFPPTNATKRSEAAVQTDVRLEASRLGIPMWRNNVGVLTDERNIPVRYGLANDSPALNKRIKSGDLIGIRPVLITPAHVGMIIGQFVSREVKAEGWSYKGTGREEAQLRWQLLVQQHGGDACFVTGKGSF
jgi:hypothetical protein